MLCITPIHSHVFLVSPAFLCWQLPLASTDTASLPPGQGKNDNCTLITKEDLASFLIEEVEETQHPHRSYSINYEKPVMNYQVLNRISNSLVCRRKQVVCPGIYCSYINLSTQLKRKNKVIHVIYFYT